MHSSLFYSFLEKNASLLVGVTSTIVLSRLLTPVETGIFSVAAAFINISQFLRDFGISNYIIQEQELTAQKLRSAMGLSLSMGIILFALFLFLSGPVAAFFNEPSLKVVITVLSINFLVVAVASIGTARLSRIMNYRAVSLINFASTVTFSAVSITLAASGSGAVSIAWASVSGVVTIILGQTIAMQRDAVIRPSFAGWRPLIRFGSFASGNGMLTTLIQRGPDILIGRLMGFADAGLFSRGNSLVTLFESALLASVRPVVANGLAAIRREGRPLDGPLLQCYSYLSAVAWPFLSVLGLLAYPIILIMFGDQWLPSIPPARWLCLAALFGTVTNIGAMAFTSVGAMRTLFFFQCLNCALVAPAVAAGCFIGLQAVAMGIVASSAISAMVSLHKVKATFGVSIAAILKSMARSALVTVAASLPPVIVLVSWGFDRTHLWAPTLVATIGAVAAWALALWMVGHPLCRELFHLVSRPGAGIETKPGSVNWVTRPVPGSSR
jgi:O-antigen/teichoic acid export membrane protein